MLPVFFPSFSLRCQDFQVPRGGPTVKPQNPVAFNDEDQLFLELTLLVRVLKHQHCVYLKDTWYKEYSHFIYSLYLIIVILQNSCFEIICQSYYLFILFPSKKVVVISSTTRSPARDWTHVKALANCPTNPSGASWPRRATTCRWPLTFHSDLT